MMAHGLLEEVQALYPLRHLKNLQTVGYSELFDYIDGKYSLEAAISKIQQHTRNYAKRQITWFQNTTDATWFNANDTDLADRIIEMIQ
jgi:tRNA dimethylallyltransferase